MGSISPPFSKTLTNLSQLVNNVNGQDWPSVEGMKFPNNRFCFVNFLTCGAIPYLLWKLLFSLSLTMCRDGWKLKPPRLMMLKFGMSRALISNQGSHFCNKKNCTELPLRIIPRPTTKLKCSIETLAKDGESQPKRMEPTPRGCFIGPQESVPNSVRNVSLPDRLRLKSNIELTGQSRSVT
ncbi:hypothetical protein CR513_45899, partial [Mucuna pruriens]